MRPSLVALCQDPGCAALGPALDRRAAGHSRPGRPVPGRRRTRTAGSLDAGQELGEHQVKENAWIAVVGGQVQVSAGVENVELGPGCLVHFDPGERHTVASREGARILMVLAPWPGAGHYAAG